MLVNALSMLALFPSWVVAFAESFVMTRVTFYRYKFMQPNRIRSMKSYFRMYDYFMDEYGADFADFDDEERLFWTRRNITDPCLEEQKRWANDDVFTGQRLAGKNPRTLRLVVPARSTRGGMKWEVLKAKLNVQFDFESAMNAVIDSDQPLTLEEVSERIISLGIAGGVCNALQIHVTNK